MEPEESPLPPMPADRNTTIDVLRTVALCAIVMAHSGVRGWLFQLRNFDVVCMAMVSAMSYRLSRAAHPGGTGLGRYLLGRCKRLVLPTYSFLCMYFALVAISRWLFPAVAAALPPPDAGRLLDAFLFGEGMTWIVRVYLLLAVAYPLIAWMDRHIPRHTVWLSLAALGIPLQCALLRFAPTGSGFLSAWLYQDGLLYFTGYGAVALVGYRHTTLPRGVRLGMAATLFAGLLLFALWSGGIPPLQEFKYPPHPCYLGYGMLATLVLYELVDCPSMARIRAWNGFRWMSRNSLWVFFWHYVGVAALRVFGACGFPAVGWPLCWTFNMGTGILLTVLQNRILAALRERKESDRSSSC